MIRAIREVRKEAEKEGLEFVRLEDRSRHKLLVFRNAFGQLMRAFVSRGGKPEAVMSMKYNTRSNFRRFARGQTEGLHVLDPEITSESSERKKPQLVVKSKRKS